MNLTSTLFDGRIKAFDVLFDFTVGEYLDSIRTVVSNNEFQRKHVASSRSVYSLWRQDNGCMSKFMHPDIVVEVAFDPNVNDWIVEGPDVVTTALGLMDPNAPDADIIAALHTLTTVYRSKIVRG